MSRSAAVTAAVALACAAAPAGAQDFPGDPVAGREYARGVCAECHYVPGGEVRPGLAPGFDEIAAQPYTTGMSLLVWLTSTPHPTMPDLILPENEAKDVVAYILSLREP